jgi:nucleolar protein 56
MVPEQSASRRDYLRAASGVGLSVVAGCLRSGTDPDLSVPPAALVDEAVAVEVNGVTPGALVDVRASARSTDGTRWESRATFEADEDGTVSVADQSPTDGTYAGTDPMGLLWSMRPVKASASGKLPPETLFVPDPEGYQVTLTASVDGETVAEATTTRRLYDPAIERRPVADERLVGECYFPPGDEAVPGVVHLHGAGGQPHLATGRLLASRGIATLALQYFGDSGGIPDTLREVPVEYVEKATSWLRGIDRVEGGVGLFGFSRGGTLALLASSRGDVDADAVVGWVPSGVVWEGLGYGRTPARTAAWSLGGEPVAYLDLAEADPGPPPTPGLPYFEPALEDADPETLAAATIPVERIDAPLLLASVADDRRWPSTTLSRRVVDRLDAREYGHAYRHERYDGAGHYVRLPSLPTPGTTRDAHNVYGGTPEANADASTGAWSATLEFLHDTLGG